MEQNFNEAKFMLREAEVIRMFASVHPEMSEADAVMYWVQKNAKNYRENAESEQKRK